jgi:tight adherence protein C
MTGAYESLLCLLWGLALAGVAWYCARIAQQITYVTLADGRRQERMIPLLLRLLLPLTANLTPMFRRPVFRRLRESTDRRLVAAGFEGLLSAEEFLALRLLCLIVFGPLWVLLVLVAISSDTPWFFVKVRVPLALLGVAWAMTYPAAWLKRALMQRHKSIQRSLPFVLDLLTLSIEAGMDFMTALQRNAERGKIDALAEELIRVVREIQLGKTRKEALRDLSRRVDLWDLRTVTNALIQADELGVSIGSILRIQADQMRQRRFDRAERLANQAPVKMLFPLMFFIFPAVFLVLLGPIFARLAREGF